MTPGLLHLQAWSVQHAQGYPLSGRLDWLAQHDPELAMKDVEPVKLRRVGQHIVEKLGPEEVLAARAMVVRVPGLGVREGFEDAERRLRVAQGEPGSGQRLLVDPSVYVLQEALEQLLLARFGLEVDVVGLLSGRFVEAVQYEARVRRVVLRPVRTRVDVSDRIMPPLVFVATR